MSEQENREFMARYAAALNGKPKPASVLDQFMTDQALKEHIEVFEAAFPNYQIEMDDMIAEGDKVVVRVTFHGVHGSDFMGVPASGKSVTATGIIIYRIANGKIVQHWMNFDTLSLMQQLGAVPAAV
jgi:steroid delta-isomerase-like uncharacterized protein